MRTRVDIDQQGYTMNSIVECPVQLEQIGIAFCSPVALSTVMHKALPQRQSLLVVHH